MIDTKRLVIRKRRYSNI